MNGRKLRARDRAERRARWWRGRLAGAADEKAVAHTEWDRTRAVIIRLDEGQQAAAWRLLASVIEQVGSQFDCRGNRPSGAQPTDARPRAREARSLTRQGRRGVR